MTEALLDPLSEVSQSDGFWADRLRGLRERVPPMPPIPIEGSLRRIVGLTLEAEGCQAPMGERCRIHMKNRDPVEAEVVGFDGDRLYLMPTTPVHGLMPNARVVPMADVERIKVGEGLLGRVLDGVGQPLDGIPPIKSRHEVSLHGHPINPLDRAPIREQLDVGVRAINALFTIGRGQRIGLFAGAGVGKSSLLGMMARYTSADVVVVGLIGERGREVKEFIEEILGEEGRKRSVVIAAPADSLPLMRLHGAMLANSVAEYFRDQGLNVLLLMDSLTRYAQAQRELALSTGELPATRGYPPSVFAKLPQLVERAGNGPDGGGSITAFYTVLVEGDDSNDPVADAARAILDGHLVLSRELADSGHYPAIDPEASVSRVMNNIADATQLQNAVQFKRTYATYNRNRDLIAVGAYQKGNDARIDEAIDRHPKLESFLRQAEHEGVSLSASIGALHAALHEPT